MKKNSDKWFIWPMCLLIFFSLGAFTSDHQRLSAGNIAVTELDSPPFMGDKHHQESEKMAGHIDKLATRPSLWPVSGEVSSYFGWRNSPWGNGSELHQGIDIANSMGTPIVATADGQVVQSESTEGYGNVVQIDHGNGIVTLYGHNSQIIVNVGQNVKKGQVISYLGNTGKSTGPHVHYEIRVNGTAVDPIGFMVVY